MLKKTYYEVLVRPVVRKAGMVLTVSHSSASTIREWVNDTSVDIKVVGNGISIRRPDSPKMRQNEQRTLLYVGNMMSHKNFPIVLQALHHLPEASLTVVSNDVDEVTRQANAISSSLLNRIKLLRGVTDDEMATLYSSSDVLVMPSSEEGFGLPAVEALTCECPVVYWSGCSGLEEVLGGFGTPVDKLADISSWVDAVRTASTQTMDMDSVNQWLKQYQWNAVADRVQTAITELKNRG